MAVRQPLVAGTGTSAGLPVQLPTGDTLPGTGSATLAFAAGAVVAAGTYPVDLPYAATLTNLRYEVGSAGGSFSVTVKVGATTVTGLSAIAVSSASTSTASATANNSVAALGRVNIVISSVVGSPTDAVLTLLWSKA